MNQRPLLFFVLLATASAALHAQAPAPAIGFRDFAPQAKLEEKFLAAPDAKLAGEHLKKLTAEPHIAASPEDYRTAEYVAEKFRAAGLETEIVPYRVRLNYPGEVRVEAWSDAGKPLMKGPTREHIPSEPFQDDPRLTTAFHGSSASGEVTAEAVYGHFCRVEDFDKLAELKVDVKGKIVLCRYGQNFRGIKVYIAQKRGAAGVIIYSDPQDDGYFQGDTYPNGPWRPETALQRGSVQFLPIYPGDAETPGVASTLDLPDSARLAQADILTEPRIVSVPLSYHDAAPILEALKGPGAPQGWQGALPFRYHLGSGGAKLHILSRQDYQRRIIWNVMGKIKGAELPDELVVVGNHRDAWTYGAVDPSSGTAAMLETVHAFGELLKTGWRPRRTVLFGSWDAEEQGLVGSTEWVEQNEKLLAGAVAYFNVDVAVSGTEFSASATPSLKPYIREIAAAVPSPAGKSVYQQWQQSQASAAANHSSSDETHIGDLGSGSDYSPFFDHLGIPASDLSSNGPYGVYHSIFDDYAWYTANTDKEFLYLQQMARVLGLEALRMAQVDVLPLDYAVYAREIAVALATQKQKAAEAHLTSLDFTAAEAALAGFTAAAEKTRVLQLPTASKADLPRLNLALRQTERALLDPSGLPNRPWFRHLIYAPGEFTGYASVVLPGVTEGIEARDAARTELQLKALATVLERATQQLQSAQ